ncbi:unannotated protein [freshwater metagenome]|uniref:Unannotated protein n=1 Tax=freshwater metagenome TaxID=449393 RepID=A0A6J7JYD7_9ZZZZ
MGAAAWLYVPASKLDTLLSKATSSADAVVIDLEDAVHPDQRPMARELVEQCLTSRAVPVDLRINPVGTDDFARDAATVARVAGHLSGIRLPKVDTAADARAAADALAEHFDRPFLVCQLESARGVTNAHDIAAVAGVQSIMLGESDLRADLRVPRGEEAGLTLARQTVVLASRAAGLEPPIGSVFPRIDDDAGLRASTELLRAYGFHGRSCIHPRQVPIVRAVFAPTEEEIAWAHAVASTAEAMSAVLEGAAKLDDGSFIDPAVERQARDILRRAGATP